MKLRSKRRELHGLVGGIGLAVGLGGLVGDLYAPGNAIAGMFAVWIVGATAVNVFTDRP